MDRPYIICHMVTSVDGKVTGDFLGRPQCEAATEIYYEMNREYKERGSGGFICGRVTMEQSFTGGWYPDLSAYQPTEREDEHFKSYFAPEKTGYYAIAFDPHGRLGWKGRFIEDYDPGYDKAQIIEVLTEQVDGRYLSYLKSLGISYIIAGEREIDVPLTLRIIGENLAPKFYLLEGGSIINGYFLRADCVDELSLVVSPITADKDSKPLFMNATLENFTLISQEQKCGALVQKHKKM